MNKRIPLLGGLALAAFPALAVAPPALPAQAPEPTPEATAEPLYLPLLRLGAWTPPGASPTTAASPRPSDPPGTLPPPGTATPSPTASPEAGSATPGIPACRDTRGDAGGLRFSLDGGRSLAPNRQRLASSAYTWALLRDPRDPDLILELHEGRLYRSLDAGCSLSLLSTLPAGFTWDRLARAPGRPDFLVASSVFAHAAAWSEDGGATWTLEPGLPDDVVNLTIAADDPWHWAFAGRQGMAERSGREARWSVSPLPVGDDSIVSAAPLPGAWGRWLLGSSFHGPYHFDAASGDWRAASRSFARQADGSGRRVLPGAAGQGFRRVRRLEPGAAGRRDEAGHLADSSRVHRACLLSEAGRSLEIDPRREGLEIPAARRRARGSVLELILIRRPEQRVPALRVEVHLL